MQEIEIYFDGYCPESLLKNKKVEMKLNKDDFWESVNTGLQIAVFPPYATILKWRGKKEFRESTAVASDVLSGLILAEGLLEDGKEIFPDTDKILHNNFELEWILDSIYASKEKHEAAKFNPNDAVFDKQKAYLETLGKEQFKALIKVVDKLAANPTVDLLLSQLSDQLYDRKLIFNFNWPAWHAGKKKINDKEHDYSTSTLLELSMLLTTIFRQDRFSDNLKYYLLNGTLNKILKRLKEILKD